MSIKSFSFLIFTVCGILMISVFLSACREKRDIIEGGDGEGKTEPTHTHSFVVKNDSECRWQECECGEKKGEHPTVLSELHK